jgi:hypothetical protein
MRRPTRRPAPQPAELGNLSTSRLVSYGFLAQAKELLIDTYQVSEVLDRRICPVCATLHGKEFQVVRERARLEQLLQQDPDALKTAAPWPRQDPESVKRLRALSEGARRRITRCAATSWCRAARCARWPMTPRRPCCRACR